MSENVTGLPNVPGLENLDGISELVTADKAPVQPQQVQNPAPVVPDKPVKAEQPRNELGQFKSSEDLLKAYKELQGFATRTSQESKTLKDEMSALRENMELLQYSRPVQQQPQSQGKDFDSMFIENPQQAVATVASQMVQKQMQSVRIAEVLDEEHEKNPQEYQERFAYANQLGSQYPQLTQTSAGVKRLFRMADEARKTDYQKRGMAFVKAVVGEDVDFEKFKSFVKKDQSQQAINANNAYMPDTTSSNRTGPETEKRTSHEAEIQAAVNKGDIDGVLNATFRELGLRK